VSSQLDETAGAEPRLSGEVLLSVFAIYEDRIMDLDRAAAMRTAGQEVAASKLCSASA